MYTARGEREIYIYPHTSVEFVTLQIHYQPITYHTLHCVDTGAYDNVITDTTLKRIETNKLPKTSHISENHDLTN